MTKNTLPLTQGKTDRNPPAARSRIRLKNSIVDLALDEKIKRRISASRYFLYARHAPLIIQKNLENNNMTQGLTACGAPNIGKISLVKITIVIRYAESDISRLTLAFLQIRTFDVRSRYLGRRPRSSQEDLRLRGIPFDLFQDGTGNAFGPIKSAEGTFISGRLRRRRKKIRKLKEGAGVDRLPPCLFVRTTG